MQMEMEMEKTTPERQFLLEKKSELQGVRDGALAELMGEMNALDNAIDLFGDTLGRLRRLQRARRQIREIDNALAGKPDEGNRARDEDDDEWD
jgi:hypothetical protein